MKIITRDDPHFHEAVTFISNCFRHAEKLSQDPTHKVGCGITDRNFSFMAYGVNRFPDGLTFKHPKLILHAEEMAVQRAWKKERNGRLIAFVTHLPCIKCSRRLWEIGVRRVYTTDKHTPGGLRDRNLVSDFFSLDGVVYRVIPWLEKGEDGPDYTRICGGCSSCLDL